MEIEIAQWLSFLLGKKTKILSATGSGSWLRPHLSSYYFPLSASAFLTHWPSDPPPPCPTCVRTLASLSPPLPAHPNNQAHTWLTPVALSDSSLSGTSSGKLSLTPPAPHWAGTPCYMIS